MNKKCLKCVTEANPLKMECSCRTAWFGSKYFRIYKASELLSGGLHKHASCCLFYLTLRGPGAKGLEQLSGSLEKMEERETLSDTLKVTL